MSIWSPIWAELLAPPCGGVEATAHVTWVLSTALLPLTTHAHTALRLPPRGRTVGAPHALIFPGKPCDDGNDSNGDKIGQ